MSQRLDSRSFIFSPNVRLLFLRSVIGTLHIITNYIWVETCVQQTLKANLYKASIASVIDQHVARAKLSIFWLNDALIRRQRG